MPSKKIRGRYIIPSSALTVAIYIALVHLDPMALDNPNLQDTVATVKMEIYSVTIFGYTIFGIMQCV